MDSRTNAIIKKTIAERDLEALIFEYAKRTECCKTNTECPKNKELYELIRAKVIELYGI
jgi:hypothetical protein